MILRTWSGSVPPDRADGFHEHLLATGMADYQRHAGCLDAQVWRRDERKRVGFTLVSWWLGEAAVRRYAGPNPDAAILYPEDEEFDLEPDTTVTHYDLAPLKPAQPLDGGVARLDAPAGCGLPRSTRT